MARHFREEPAGRTAITDRPFEPADKRRRRLGGTGHVSLPYGQAATYHYSYPSAAVRGDGLYEEPARGGIHLVGRGLLLLVAWAFRLAAFAVFALLTLNVLSISAVEGLVTRVTDLLTRYLPWGQMALLEVDTPFGGVFRVDLALMVLALLVVDWLVCRLRRRLR